MLLIGINKIAKDLDVNRVFFLFPIVDGEFPRAASLKKKRPHNRESDDGKS